MKRFNQIFRTLSRSRLFLSVNVLGMAIALAVATMLLLFVVNELSYDRHFANSERIVRLNSVFEDNGQKKVMAICLRSAYTELPEAIPGIEAAAQIYRYGDVVLTHDNDRFQGISLRYADPEFFKVFQLKVLDGSLETALADPFKAVITAPKAMAIFGTTQAVGQQFSIGGKLYTVTAVVELPSNTHLSFDVLGSMSSIDDLMELLGGGTEFFTYYLLDAKNQMAETCLKIQQQYAAMLTTRFPDRGGKKDALLEPLTNIHLHGQSSHELGPQGNLRTVWILIGLTLMILLLAVTNFVNLFIAQADSRMMEVGVRKTNGGSIGDMAVQFFAEAAMVVLLAFVLGLLLSVWAFAYVSTLVGIQVDPSQFGSPAFILGLSALIVLVIACSAAYPAFYLSRLNPVDVLMRKTTTSKRRLTAAIVIIQSVVTIVLMSVIITIGRQTAYMQDTPIGFNPKNVAFVRPVGRWTHYDALRENLMKTPGVEQVDYTSFGIGDGSSGGAMSLTEAGESQKVNIYRVGPNFGNLMQFELLEGRFFNETDRTKPVIVLNMSAVKAFNMSPPYAEQSVYFREQQYEVVGVIRDFFYDSPGQAVAPLTLIPSEGESIICIRFNESLPQPQAAALALKAFRQFDPEILLDIQWSEDINAAKFESEKRFSRIITTSTLLSLLIAMLGLLAIHSYTALRRTKEIGIRRVNGATVGAVFTLLSAGMLKWIAIAGCIALPAAYYICSEWLANYTNRISVDASILLVPVLLQAMLALMTTWGVSMKVSSQNPVEALRKE